MEMKLAWFSYQSTEKLFFTVSELLKSYSISFYFLLRSLCQSIFSTMGDFFSFYFYLELFLVRFTVIALHIFILFYFFSMENQPYKDLGSFHVLILWRESELGNSWEQVRKS